MTDLQQRLCNLLQRGLPVCTRPFEEIAARLGCTEQQVLEHTRDLVQAGVVRRIGPVVNGRALGRTSTLVAARVPARSLREVVDVVNGLPGVSHNYLRDHPTNLWFTLQGRGLDEIQGVLGGLRDQLGVEFHSLPARRVFKLEVFFDATGQERPCAEPPLPPCARAVDMTGREWAVLSGLQKGLRIEPRPWDGLGEGAVSIIEALVRKGVVRRIAAVVDHRRLGFTANGLFVAEVHEDRIAAAGRGLAVHPWVTHCYQRGSFPGWPYTLYAMIHGRSAHEIRSLAQDAGRSHGLDQVLLLETLQEFKKRPVTYTPDTQTGPGGPP
ncbi:MAG: hypothetical protein KBE04_02055 [Phycisphaerae bacterium]|nr:hypothetical protein [Phycisphaerae bacterium]